MSAFEPTRRAFLAAGAATLTLGSGRLASAFDKAAASQYGPFKMGLQSYSLRGFTKGGKPDVDKALEVTKGLGLGVWEFYPAHFPVTADSDAIAGYKAKLAAAGVTTGGFGVNRFTKDHEANRKFFEFGKAMGVTYMSADPDPDAFDSLDKLVEEYGIAIGIHNHGPVGGGKMHRYATIESIEKAIKDHHEKIGVCNDTGHFLRTKIDPLDVVKAFGKRTYGVHLKDVKNATEFCLLGEGDLKLVEFLKALKALNYSHALAVEYEENPANPTADIEKCLEAARKAVAQI